MNEPLDFLYATILLDEYNEAAQEARDAFAKGQKLKALGLAILAHKIYQDYEQMVYASMLI
jgi:hypothetical protein